MDRVASAAARSATPTSSTPGRPCRTWRSAASEVAPPGRALLCSLVIRQPPRLLPLAAGVAVAAVTGDDAQVKWPNDVLVAGRKVAGILVEGRPQEHWAVLGIGLNVALREDDFPPELRGRASSRTCRAARAPSSYPARLRSRDRRNANR